MNRLVVIGNGFDLAHGLKTSYADFINWYWDYRMHMFANTYSSESKDYLCCFKTKFGEDGRELWSTIAFSHNYFNSTLGKVYIGKDIITSIIDDKKNYETKFSPFFSRIIQSIETKGWVDIENEYYKLLTEYALPALHVSAGKESVKDLNEQLLYIQQLLMQYLNEVEKVGTNAIKQINNEIYAPISTCDISIEKQHVATESYNWWLQQNERLLIQKAERFGLNVDEKISEVNHYKEKVNLRNYGFADSPSIFRLPDNICLVNFNYTHTVNLYWNKNVASLIHIHGRLDEPQGVIFGYGDEKDENFKRLQNLNNGECLKNVKSMRYLESVNYRNVLGFMEMAPFQVYIMGHSCGNSDRTLLNTIFEHKNCVSIKPYYYEKEDGTDNYIEIIQNISRNFTDMKLMRDRVVNKTQCEPLVKV